MPLADVPTISFPRHVILLLCIVIFFVSLRSAASNTSTSASSSRKKSPSRAKTALDDASLALDATVANPTATAADKNDTPNHRGRVDGASSGNQSSADGDAPVIGGNDDEEEDDDDDDEGVLVGRLRAVDGGHLQPSDDDGNSETAGGRKGNWTIPGRSGRAEEEAAGRSQGRGSRGACIEGTVGQNGGGRRGAGEEMPPPKKVSGSGDISWMLRKMR